jgi:hypothetical protein
MNYTRHIGKAGVYGEHKVVEWKDEFGRLIARTYDNNDGTETVTLYSSGNVPHPRFLPTHDRRNWDICEAWVKERGFDNLTRETSDVRAYND